MPTQYQAQLRHAQHYLTRLRDMDRAYRVGSNWQLDGLTLFDAERAQIDAGWQWAQTASPPQDPLLVSYADLTIAVGDQRYAPRSSTFPSWRPRWTLLGA